MVQHIVGTSGELGLFQFKLFKYLPSCPACKSSSRQVTGEAIIVRVTNFCRAHFLSRKTPLKETLFVKVCKILLPPKYFQLY